MWGGLVNLTPVEGVVNNVARVECNGTREIGFLFLLGSASSTQATFFCRARRNPGGRCRCAQSGQFLGSVTLHPGYVFCEGIVLGNFL